jgi:hypothetical protein
MAICLLRNKVAEFIEQELLEAVEQWAKKHGI